MARRRRTELHYGRTRDLGEGKPEKDEHPDWRQSRSGLWVPEGTPEGGRRPPVGFARALADGASGAEL